MRHGLAPVLFGARFVKPDPLPALPITLNAIVGHGRVRTSPDAITAARTYNASYIVNTEIFFSSTGTDGSGTGSSAGSPVSLRRAIQDLHGSYLTAVDAGDYDPSGFFFRDVDTSQENGPEYKEIRGAAGIRPQFKIAGETLSSATWTETGGGHTDVWQMSLATTNNVNKVTRSDLVDSYGYPLRLFKCVDLADLDGRSSGQFCDTTGRIQYVKLGAGVNVENAKSVLTGYYELTGVTRLARFLCQNVPAAFNGCDFKGIQVRGLNKTPAAMHDMFRTQIWTRNCTNIFANNIAVLVDGGFLVSEEARIHGSDSDNFLYNGDAEGERCFGMEINCYGSGAGEFAYGGTSSANDNYSSIHSAEGVCRWGCVGTDSYGPVIRDRDDDASGTYVWNVSVITSNSHSASGLGFSIAPSGASMRCEQWLDSCIDISETGANLSVTQAGGALGIAHLNNCNYPVRTVTGTVNSYNRTAP